SWFRSAPGTTRKCLPRIGRLPINARRIVQTSHAPREDRPLCVHSYPRARRPQFSYSIRRTHTASLVLPHRERVVCMVFAHKQQPRNSVSRSVYKTQDGYMEHLQNLDLSPMSAVGAALLRFILAGFWIAHWWFKVEYRGMPATEAFFLQQGLPAWLGW